MKELLTVLIMVLALNLSSAQDTFQYKGIGGPITYAFTDSTLVVSTKKLTNEAKVKLVGKSEASIIYQTTEPFMGMMTKFQFVLKSGDKYMMIQTSLDDFTKESTQAFLKVTKIN